MKQQYEEFIAEKRAVNINKNWFNAAFALLKREKNLNKKIHLDVGCGQGEFAIKCNELLGTLPIGLDISQYYIEKFKKNGYKAFVVDFEKDKFPLKDNSVDLVTCLEVIEHVFDVDNLLSEINRVLKPGGIFVISTPNIMQIRHRFEYMFKGITPHKEGHHVRFFTKDRLEHYLYFHGFDTVDINPIYVVVPFPFQTIARLSGLLDAFPTLFYHRFCYKLVKKAPGIKIAECYWDELNKYDNKTKKTLRQRVKNAFDWRLISKLTQSQFLDKLT